MNDTTQKIAAEAWDKLHPCSSDPEKRKRGIAIIQSAIEKATEWWDNEIAAAIDYLDGNDDRLGQSELHRKLREAFEATGNPRAAHASDWKPVTDVRGMLSSAKPAHASEQLYRIKEGTDLSYLPHWLIPVDEASESDLLRAASECSFEAGRGVERALEKERRKKAKPRISYRKLSTPP